VVATSLADLKEKLDGAVGALPKWGHTTPTRGRVFSEGQERRRSRSCSPAGVAVPRHAGQVAMAFGEVRGALDRAEAGVAGDLDGRSAS
jgi:hypothetical protein